MGNSSSKKVLNEEKYSNQSISKSFSNLNSPRGLALSKNNNTYQSLFDIDDIKIMNQQLETFEC